MISYFIFMLLSMGGHDQASISNTLYTNPIDSNIQDVPIIDRFNCSLKGSISRSEEGTFTLIPLAKLELIKDSIVIKTTFADYEGDYNFGLIEEGDYAIRYHYVGESSAQMKSLNVTTNKDRYDLVLDDVNGLYVIYDMPPLLQGKVVDKYTGQGIENVDIALSNSKYRFSAITNSLGQYSFENLEVEDCYYTDWEITSNATNYIHIDSIVGSLDKKSIISDIHLDSLGKKSIKSGIDLEIVRYPHPINYSTNEDYRLDIEVKKMEILHEPNGKMGGFRGTIADHDSMMFAFANILVKDMTDSTIIRACYSDIDGVFEIQNLPPRKYHVEFTYVGHYIHQLDIEIKPDSVYNMDLQFSPYSSSMAGVIIITGDKFYRPTKKSTISVSAISADLVNNTGAARSGRAKRMRTPYFARASKQHLDGSNQSREEGPIPKGVKNRGLYENPRIETTMQATSTFSIDVDKASYTLVRDAINKRQRPNPANIRIEELVNYFDYDYGRVIGDDAFSYTTALTDCPWNEEAKLFRIGMKGRTYDFSNTPPAHIILLIDISGSMSEELPKIKSGLRNVINNLREEDKISIVTYANGVNLALKPTSIINKELILETLDGLSAGGGTNGSAGICLAYQLAEYAFIKGGNNRVILATDGDFNIGLSSEEELVDLISKQRETGVFLSVLGFGKESNYEDGKMEQLADNGNGSYAFVDSRKEVEKLLVNELDGTLITVAKDVKLQVEFDPTVVKSYRLVGYENRLLQNKDFDDDTKDAGELGSGNTVTAFYELELYDQDLDEDDKILDFRIRYKAPDAIESQLQEEAIYYNYTNLENANVDTRWAVSVAAWGMLLRKSKFVNNMKIQEVIDLAESSKNHNDERKDCFKLMKESKKFLK